MVIDLTPIILAIIALICALISVFIIPWLKSQISLNNDKLTENQKILLKLAVTTAVKAAEQLYNSGEGKAKKEYVIKYLESQGYKVNEPAIDAAIEEAVYDLKNQFIE